MSDTDTCLALMNEIEKKHIELSTLLENNCSASIGFQIEQILARDEEAAIKEGIETLDVSIAPHNSLIKYHNKYYRDKALSTQFVDRMPGIIVIQDERAKIQTLVTQINQFKDEMLSYVHCGRNKDQRHEFIHSTFPRIMTDQFRRHIHIIHDDVTNCWFNWSSRPIPETMSLNEGIAFLEKEKDNPRSLFTHKEWESMLNSVINDIRAGSFSKIQRLKRLKLLPAMTYQYIDIHGQKKRNTKNANTPFLLFNQTDNALPVVSHLSSYVRPENKPTSSRSKKKQLLSSYFNLVGVIE